MAPPALHTEHLTKRFGVGSLARMALDGLDLSVQPGQVYGFLGKNGAGKTTTIRILLDLMRPSGGVAYLFGADPRRDRRALRRVGALVEGAAFYPYLSGRENLELLQRMTPTGKTLPIDPLLERVGLAERARDRFGTYSTGLKQRLGIAAALLGDPELVILDEPINGLDPIGVVEIRRLLRELVDKEGKTVFFSSHLLNEIEQLCDRIAIIDEGRLICEGSLQELLSSRGETIQIEVGNTATALTALNGNWSARQVTEAVIELSASRAQIPEIVAQLVAQQVEVFQVTSPGGSLENLFLSLVN